MGESRRSKWTRRAIFGFSAVVLGRYAVQQAARRYHYATTPSFDDYLRGHPVSVDFEHGLSRGTELTALGERLDYLLESRELAKRQVIERRFGLELFHGNEPLLNYSQDLSLSFDTKSWRLERLGLTPATIENSRPELRGIAISRVPPAEELRNPELRRSQRLDIDVFVLAGAGECTSHHLLATSAASPAPIGKEPVSMEDEQYTRSLRGDFGWSSLLGIDHNTEPLPEEGWMHHVRFEIGLDWTGDSVPVSLPPLHAVNTSEYSFDVVAKIEDPDHVDRTGADVFAGSWRRTHQGELW